MALFKRLYDYFSQGGRENHGGNVIPGLWNDINSMEVDENGPQRVISTDNVDDMDTMDVDMDYDNDNKDSEIEENEEYNNHDVSLEIIEPPNNEISSTPKKQPLLYDKYVADGQYGTSFANARNVSVNSDFKTIKFNSNTDDFSIDLNKEVDSYESKIHKFYWPVLPKTFQTFHDVNELTKNNYQFTVDLKIQELEKEKKSKISRVTPLSKPQLQKITSILRQSPNTMIVMNYSIDIKVRDMLTLKDGQWLNDNIIDYYFNLISNTNGGYFSWTSHFFSTLNTKGYQGVKRWSKRQKLNLFEKRLIFVPINISSTHWALAVINNDEKSIGYYDSLNMNGNKSALIKLQQYIEGEGERLQIPVDINEYRLNHKIQTPQQMNGYDCGVFTCICALYLSRFQPLTYSQNDISTFRKRMIYEILENKLL